MRIEKSFIIAAPREEVWNFVSSPENVGMCFPGCQSVKALGDSHYQAVVKVHVGPIKTVFNVGFEEIEKRPMEFSAYDSQGEEGNRASRLKARNTLTLSTIDAETTRVDYASELTIVGRLGKFGAGMMKKKADALGDEFVAALRARIEGPPAPEAAQAEAVAQPGRSRRWPVYAVLALAALAALAYYLWRM